MGATLVVYVLTGIALLDAELTQSLASHWP